MAVNAAAEQAAVAAQPAEESFFTEPLAWVADRSYFVASLNQYLFRGVLGHRFVQDVTFLPSEVGSERPIPLRLINNAIGMEFSTTVNLRAVAKREGLTPEQVFSMLSGAVLGSGGAATLLYGIVENDAVEQVEKMFDLDPHQDFAEAKKARVTSLVRFKQHTSIDMLLDANAPSSFALFLFVYQRQHPADGFPLLLQGSTRPTKGPDTWTPIHEVQDQLAQLAKGLHRMSLDTVNQFKELQATIEQLQADIADLKKGPAAAAQPE